MSKGFEQTFLQRYTNGQQVYKKDVQHPNY